MYIYIHSCIQIVYKQESKDYTVGYAYNCPFLDLGTADIKRIYILHNIYEMTFSKFDLQNL